MAGFEHRAPVSLIGKLPQRADFVRIGASGPAANELDQWLVRAAEALYFAKVKLPPAPVRYAYACASAPSLLLGVLAASRDRVGREFPITAFATLPMQSLAGKNSALLAAAGDFFERTEALLDASAALSPEALGERLAQLPAPELGSIDERHIEFCEQLRRASAASFFERGFGPLAAGAHHYALFTFSTAAQAHRAPAHQMSVVVLDCPAADTQDALSWLELADRLLRWPAAVPSWLWTRAPGTRLLISLGGCPSDLLRAAADPAYAGARLWPLHTSRPEAVDRARAAIEPALADLADDPALPLDRVFESLGRFDLPG